MTFNFQSIEHFTNVQIFLFNCVLSEWVYEEQ